MPAINWRMLTDAVISSSSESILDFVIHCVYIQRCHVKIIYVSIKSDRVIAPMCFESARAQTNPML